MIAESGQFILVTWKWQFNAVLDAKWNLRIYLALFSATCLLNF